MNKRVCNTCKEEKEISCFHKKGNGHQHICKDCRKRYIRDHYLKNKEAYIVSSKASRLRVKDFFETLKSGLKCSVCSENHPSCLDFHHKESHEKDFEVAKYKNVGRERLLKEIEKCVILCSNCHRKLHYELFHSSTGRAPAF